MVALFCHRDKGIQCLCHLALSNRKFSNKMNLDSTKIRFITSSPWGFVQQREWTSKITSGHLNGFLVEV